MTTTRELYKPFKNAFYALEYQGIPLNYTDDDLKGYNKASWMKSQKVYDNNYRNIVEKYPELKSAEKIQKELNGDSFTYCLCGIPSKVCEITNDKFKIMVGTCCIKHFMPHAGRYCEDCSISLNNKCSTNLCSDCKVKKDTCNNCTKRSYLSGYCRDCLQLSENEGILKYLKDSGELCSELGCMRKPTAGLVCKTCKNKLDKCERMDKIHSKEIEMRVNRNDSKCHTCSKEINPKYTLCYTCYNIDKKIAERAQKSKEFRERMLKRQLISSKPK